MLIDLGKMRTTCLEPEISSSDKNKKKEKYYPTSYLDDVGDVDIDDLPMDKDIFRGNGR